MALPIAMLVSFLLILEEINTPYVALNRADELARLVVPQMPPASCRAFYVSGWKGQDRILEGFPVSMNNAYAHNVTAMMIAQNVGIPTINGVSSMHPPDWNFGEPNRPDYDERMMAYARNHNVVGLCRFDLNTKEWSVMN